MRNPYRLLYFLFFILFSSCSNNPLDIDVSGVKTEPVKLERFEKDLFKNGAAQAPMIAHYGDFYKGFLETIICTNGMTDPSCGGGIRSFVSDPDMRSAYDNCLKTYPSVDFLEEDINDAFKHFHYYFPDRPLPKVYTMMSGFNYSFLRLDKAIGIGLEMYLGSDSKFYTMLQYPKYKMANMSKAYILPDFVKGWMMTEFENKNEKNDFLTKIVDEGKIAYLTDALLPKLNDTLKMGFSAKQLDWCKVNEGHMWSFFISRKLLYSTDYQEIIKFTNEGPFTTGFAKESPARTGCWIGWQIVRSYMARNKHITLQQLMETTDAQKILAAAAYKPKL
jgi:hypothetical protein